MTHADLDAMVWDFRLAMTLHRVADARHALDQALSLAQLHGAAAGTRFSLALDAATLAQFTGDLRGAHRYAQQMPACCADDALHRYWSNCYAVRQATLRGLPDEAAGAAHALLDAAAAPQVDPARRAGALSELASWAMHMGRWQEAAMLYERGCESLERLGTHPEWVADWLVDLARIQFAMARLQDERALGALQQAGPVSQAVMRSLRHQALQTLQSAHAQQAPAWADGLLARSALAMAQLGEADEAPAHQARDSFTQLTIAYETHRLILPFVWSSCELARLRAAEGDSAQALAALGQARRRLPADGFDAAHEQLDFTEHLVMRRQGNGMRGLLAYQRYAQRVMRRESRVPAAWRDGSLVDLARRLSGSPQRRVPARAETAAAHQPAATAANAHLRELLTLAERSVMHQLCQDARLTNREIATALGIAPTTVRNHLSAIFRKLGAHSREEALARWGGNDGDGHAGLALKGAVLMA